MYVYHTLYDKFGSYTNHANMRKVYTREHGLLYHIIHYEVYAYVACSSLTELASHFGIYTYLMYAYIICILTVHSNPVPVRQPVHTVIGRTYDKNQRLLPYVVPVQTVVGRTYDKNQCIHTYCMYVYIVCILYVCKLAV